MTPHFSYLNHPSSHLLPSPLPHLFVLTALPGTDIWKKPPSHSAFSAPLAYTSLPLSSFKRARVTVVADWKTLFDQGGLCLILPEVEGEEEEEAGGRGRRWIKTGVEFFNGAAHVSAVACDRWADWSLHDPPLTNGKVTMEIEREVKKGKGKNERTATLWIYIVEDQGSSKEKRRAVREVTWVFEDGIKEGIKEEKEEEEEGGFAKGRVGAARRECWVGVYAAKPNKDEGNEKAEEGLEVVFEGLEVEAF